MSLRVLFEAPTVAELSAEIERLLALKHVGMNNNDVRSLLESTCTD